MPTKNKKDDDDTKELDLIPLPALEDLEDWVTEKVAKQEVAVLELGKLTVKQIRDNEVAGIKCVGNKEDIIVLGDPYLGKHITYVDPENPDKGILRTNRYVQNLGIPLITLYWANEFGGFVCVRSDVYVKMA